MLNTSEMTREELDRAISEASSKRRNAETDSSWNAWDARLETLYHELEQRELDKAGA